MEGGDKTGKKSETSCGVFLQGNYQGIMPTRKAEDTLADQVARQVHPLSVALS